jgi:hypothetical protein
MSSVVVEPPTTLGVGKRILDPGGRMLRFHAAQGLAHRGPLA